MRHLTLFRRSRVRVKASLGVSPLRTTRSTPSACTERITASVAAIMGGESMTINLNFVRSSAMASTSLWEESKSAGFGGSGPVEWRPDWESRDAERKPNQGWKHQPDRN